MNNKIEGFEDLIAWQKARELTRAIYQVTKSISFANDHSVTNQLRRAAVSVMSNITEGFERGNPGDFHRFLVIAKASCAEIRSQFYVAFDSGYLKQAEVESLTNQAREVSRIVGGLRAGVRNAEIA